MIVTWKILQQNKAKDSLILSELSSKGITWIPTMSTSMIIRSTNSPGSFQVNLPGPIQVTFGDHHQMVVWEEGSLKVVDLRKGLGVAKKKAAIRIQSWWRMKMVDLRKEREWMEDIRRYCGRYMEATRIQSWWRMRIARVKMEEIRREVEAEIEAWATIASDLYVDEDRDEDARELRELEREFSERNRAEKGLPIHGLQRGRKNGNEPGSFWISKKKGTVVSGSSPQGKNGDQRWSLGMKGEEYCPKMRIIGIGKHGIKHCICQCERMIFT